ncbi:conserved exported hypothetical protein [Paraburkholderia tropica]|uniref:lysozyme inhibitor LprI family protein n=1 Tax=Paraburkholderia TaxID=1822464 RepID=UPI001CB2F360|nr:MULTISPECIES: hypothetical protein [Paraburkholderia]CAG9207053.1 conserved exported hypothetical protein [Paraburkholderia tropica]
MNREQKIRRAHSLRRGLNVAALALFASLAGSPFAQAASFHCPHNASASERLVCNDPTLSALDDKLAALYHSAIDATPDSTALEADRVSQWQWRQHNCKDKACVTDWYNRRIAELQGDLQHGKQATVQRVKDGVADQHLAPSAQDAVLEMKGIDAAPKGQNDKPAPTADGSKPAAKTGAKLAGAHTDASLHLEKMPSGVAADARQKHLADSHTHAIPADEVAPVKSAKPAATAETSAKAASMAGSGTAFAKAAGIASLDAPAAAKPAAAHSSEEKPADAAATDATHAAQASAQESSLAAK